ncbi:unnamed protein product [Mytilus coruscus]|uniref:Uncharacterized protein n=1 Tax=Mytilus coruscus TaxID=42192 RepID=A0A6J8DB88_MYTCO|nr:unnamed protein product [Mytilus coruscus]
MACQFYNNDKPLQCSEDIINLRKHNYDEQVDVCTECGLLPSPSCNLQICSSHFLMYLETNEKRKRGKSCEVPFFINSQEQSNAKRRSDRELSLSNVETINILHGLVLTVGTDKIIAANNLVELGQVQTKQTRKIDQVTALDDSGPIKRTRKVNTVLLMKIQE